MCLDVVLLGPEAGNLLLHIDIADRNNFDTAIHLFADPVTGLHGEASVLISDSSKSK